MAGVTPKKHLPSWHKHARVSRKNHCNYSVCRDTLIKGRRKLRNLNLILTKTVRSVTLCDSYSPVPEMQTCLHLRSSYINLGKISCVFILVSDLKNALFEFTWTKTSHLRRPLFCVFRKEMELHFHYSRSQERESCENF